MFLTLARKRLPRSSTRAWIVLLPAILVACATPLPPVNVQASESVRAIYVVRRDWHTGLLFRVADIPDQSWSVLRDFPEAKFLEVGWGDRDYYRAQEPDVWMGIKALFWPTPGTLHVVGFRGRREEIAAQGDIVALRLPPPLHARLYLRLRASFDIGLDGTAITLGPGLYGDSRFYASRERFSLFKTCNVWTAQLLREAGVPVKPFLGFSAGNLLRQVRLQGADAPTQTDLPTDKSIP